MPLKYDPEDLSNPHNPDNPAYATGVLKLEHHTRMVASLDRYSQLAGIPKRMIWTPAAPTLEPAVIDWLRNIKFKRAEGRAGIVFTGKFEPAIDTRMQLVCGVLIRNWIDARYTTVQAVLQTLKDGDTPPGTVLCIPNFFTGPREVGKTPQWLVSELHAMLLARHAAEKLTMLYVTDPKDLAKDYGPLIAQHLEENYDTIAAEI